ncbi:MAG: efflux RND transporter periplasmic adaptor subunit [Alphaproteobacteria bacterium]|nr:efflux RND transporter periplasmic adaptor subunit [Alphaproteobacteria bacterium]
MQVKKIQSKNILSKVVYSLLCVALGWYLKAKMTPNFAGAWNNEPPHVLVKSLSKADVSTKKKYIASVEAINSVDIVPQVSGYLEKILFEDGSEIQKGDDIFLIDQRRYQADLKAAQAAVKQLTSEYKRIQSLHNKKFMSDKELDLAESNLQKAEAALDLAKLNLEWTQIKAPIDGVIGKAAVTEGNLVSPATPKLARIVQTKPIRVAFSVTDKERTDFLENLDNAKDVFVDIAMPNGEVETTTAENLFFDNEVNAQTATIPVYVDVDNEDNVLVPGNYVDIAIRFNQGKEAVLVPQVALSADINGSYVMTVDEENIAHQRYLELGEVSGDMQIVLKGLNGSEKVVVQGLQKVQDGVKVNPTSVEPQD